MRTEPGRPRAPSYIGAPWHDDYLAFRATIVGLLYWWLCHGTLRPDGWRVFAVRAERGRYPIKCGIRAMRRSTVVRLSAPLGGPPWWPQNQNSTAQYFLHIVIKFK